MGSDVYRRKLELDHMAAMLSRSGGRGYQVRKDQTVYGDERHDFDPDFDSDLDEEPILLGLCALLLILVLAGCATGRDCRTPLGDAALTPAAALAAEGAVGRYQTWGGVLIETRNLEDSTELEVVGYPLNRCGRPDTTAGSVGRFILVQQGYQELADLKPGRKVSATGRIIGIRDGRVGKTLYRFPVLDGGLPRLWPEDRVDQSDRRPRFSIGIGGGSGWSGGGIGVWF